VQGVSKLRNRVIGRVFHELHLIEQWGSGIQRMTAACREAGLKPPRLEEIGTNFRVTISSARVRPPPDGRNRPAHPRFVRRWSCAVDGSRGEAYRTLPASYPDTVEIDRLARPSCRNRHGSARSEASVYDCLRIPR
jgi:hypothetical protein